MELRDVNVEITWMPIVPLKYGLDGSTTLNATLVLDIVGG
jgi:hypothetical protein